MFSAFLSHLYRAGTVGYFHYLPQRRSDWFPVNRPPAIYQSPTSHAYFGVNPCSAVPQTNAQGIVVEPQFIRGQAAYISAINCLYADFDADHWVDGQALVDHIQALPLQPSVLVSSGGGYHAYWLLDSPFMLETDAERSAAKHIIAAWVEFVKGDMAAKDLTRILRIPGTWNVKYSPMRPVAFCYCNLDCVYSLPQFGELLPPVVIPVPRNDPPTWERSTDIQDFNARHDIVALLESFGYARRGRYRMTSPYSGSKRSGVSIRDDNRAFVFTGTDPLCTGYHVRPFDVIKILQCNGDFRSALELIKRGTV